MYVTSKEDQTMSCVSHVDYFGWPPDPAHPRVVCWSAESALNPVTVILMIFVLVTFFVLGQLVAFLVFLVVLFFLTQYYL